MTVKSLTWCSITVAAALTAALLSTAPVSAHSDDTYQHTQNQNQENNNDQADKKVKVKDPTITVETGACVFLGDNEGTIGVDVTNPNDFNLTYKVVVNGEEKAATIAAQSTEYVAFTNLAIGHYTVAVTGPHDTQASGSATITQCHEHELPTVSVDACGCVNPSEHDGRLTLTINNTNDYAVTYTVRIDGRSQDVFVDAHSANTVTFEHLKAGDYDIEISGDDCTHLCLHATVEQCPAQRTQPGQGSGTVTPVVPTPAPTPAPVAAPAAPVAAPTPVAQPTVLPDTSAVEPTAPATVVAKVQTPKIASPTSLVLVAVGLPMIAAGAVLRRQQLANKAE